MSDGINLGKAYVQIIPSAEGIKGKLSGIMDGEAGNAGKSAGGSFGSVFGDVLKANLATDAIKGAFNAITGMAKGAASAIGGLVSDAVSSYASYEQLIGGVEKLYGDAAGKLSQYAEEAYKTSGLSANAYMETATSFSASLINSLDGDVQKAADLTDVAMRAMSDNVNVFGSDFQSVQNAFQGFAKQNYTMLDNLKLGYGGTKSEMERLIADANEFRSSIGETADLSIESFADVVQAIQSVQEAQNIAGTTNKEAMSTIEGSATAVKAAWANVITAIGRGEGLKKAFDGLISSLFGDGDGGLLNQIIPRIQTAMEGVAEFITTVAPMIAEKIPVIIEMVLPPLIESAGTLISALANALTENAVPLLIVAGDLISQFLEAMVTASGENSPSVIGTLLSDIVGVFVENYTYFFDLGLQILTNMMNGLASAIPDILYYATEIITSFAGAVMNALPGLIDAAVAIVTTLATGIADTLPELIPEAIAAILLIVETLLDKNNISQIVDAGIAILEGLVEGINNALPILVQMLPEIIITIVETLGENLPKIIEAGVTLIGSLIEGLVKAIPDLIAALPKVISAIWDTITKVDWIDLGSKILKGLIDGIKSMFGALGDVLGDLVDMIADAIGGPVGKAIKWGKDLIVGFIDGIKSGAGALWDGLCWVGNGVADLIGFSVPEKGPMHDADKWGPDMMELIAKGITDNAYKVTDTVSRLGSMISDSLSDDLSASAINVAADVNTSGRGINNVNMGGVTIEVYGAEGQSEIVLAEQISAILNQQVYSAEAVFA